MGPTPSMGPSEWTREAGEAEAESGSETCPVSGFDDGEGAVSQESGQLLEAGEDKEGLASRLQKEHSLWAPWCQPRQPTADGAPEREGGFVLLRGPDLVVICYHTTGNSAAVIGIGGSLSASRWLGWGGSSGAETVIVFASRLLSTSPRRPSTSGTGSPISQSRQNLLPATGRLLRPLLRLLRPLLRAGGGEESPRWRSCDSPEVGSPETRGLASRGLLSGCHPEESPLWPEHVARQRWPRG